MQWLSLGSAWFSLSCFIIVALYLLKKRYTPKHISSHILWQQALQEQEANKPWQRLKRQLLLWMQLLIALFIVLSLMGPAIEKQLASGTHTIIVLDRSLSMATTSSDQGDEESLLEQAKQELIHWVDQEASGGDVTVIINGDYPEIIANRQQQQAQIIEAIQRVEPYYGISDDNTAISLARALASNHKHANIYFYSDLSFWLSSEQAEMVNHPSLSEHWNLYGVDRKGEDERIRSFIVSRQDNKIQGFLSVLHKKKANHPLDIVVYAFDRNGRVIQQIPQQQLPETTGVTTFLFEQLPEAYYYRAELKLHDEDQIPYNNRELATLVESSDYSTLLISKGNLFIEKALQLMNINVIKYSPDDASPTAEQLDDIQFLIVDGSYNQLRDDPSWSSILEQYPLWIIDRPQAANLAELKQVAPVISDHVISQYFSMDDTYISKLSKLSSDELGAYDTVLSYGGQPAIIAGHQEQQPFVRFAFSLQDSDLALRPAFPILIMNTIEYMTSGSKAQLGRILVQSEPAITLAPATEEVAWQMITKHSMFAADQATLSRSTDAEFVENSQIIKQNGRIIAPNVPGLYRLIETNAEQERIAERIAVVAADVSEYSSQQLNNMATEQLQPIKQLEQAKAETKETKSLSSIVPWLAVLLLLLLFVEWEVYRRGL